MLGDQLLNYKDIKDSVIDLSSLKNGVYFITINTNREKHIEKVILAK